MSYRRYLHNRYKYLFANAESAVPDTEHMHAYMKHGEIGIFFFGPLQRCIGCDGVKCIDPTFIFNQTSIIFPIFIKYQINYKIVKKLTEFTFADYKTIKQSSLSSQTPRQFYSHKQMLEGEIKVLVFQWV